MIVVIPAIMVSSGKGGVGKTLVSVNIAHTLSRKYHVGLIDLDVLNPNVTYVMGIPDRPLELDTTRKVLPYRYDGNIDVFSPNHYYFSNGGKREISPDENALNDFVRFAIRFVKWNEPEVFVVDSDPGSRNIIPPLHSLLKNDMHVVLVVENSISSIADAERMYDKLFKRGIDILTVIGNRIIDHDDSLVVDMCKRLDINYAGYIAFDPMIQRNINRGEPFLDSINGKVIEEVCDKICQNVLN